VVLKGGLGAFSNPISPTNYRFDRQFHYWTNERRACSRALALLGR